MGIGIVAITTSQKKEITVIPPSGFPFTAGSAYQGTSVEPGTGKIILGQVVGTVGNPGVITKNIEVPIDATSGGFLTLTYPDLNANCFISLNLPTVFISGDGGIGIPAQLQIQDAPTNDVYSIGYDNVNLIWTITGALNGVAHQNKISFRGSGVAPTANVQLGAGQAGAGNGQLKFDTTPALLTTPEKGVAEFNGTNLFFTRIGGAGTRENVFVGVSGAAAPGTVAAGAVTNRYGGATNFLGDPNNWASVVISGVTFKIPLYT